MRGGWMIDVDIQGFFDNLDHGHLRTFLDQRVRDGVLRSTIDKWLKAGVLDHGQVTYPEAGSPQGARQSWRTSTFTRCWTCGFSTWSSLACKGEASWSGMRTTL